MPTKSKNKLEKELKRGYASFRAWGMVGLGEDSIGEPQVSKHSTYKYANANFALKFGEGQQVYVQLMGGYDPAKPILKRFSKNKDEGIMDIKWEHRDNEEILKQVADNSFIFVSLEHKEDGKLDEKKFLSELDAIAYLKTNLKDGEEVFVSGDIEYSRYNGKIQRRLNIKRIRLNEGYKKSDGTEVEPHKHEILGTQTYLVDNTSVSKRYDKELIEDGKTIISAFVPQYISKEDGKEIKEVVALPQSITVTATEENLELRKKVVEKFFKVKSRDVVREITCNIGFNEGYEQSSGDIELNDEVKELIELGLADEDEIKSELTIRGNKISEVLFLRPRTDKDESGQPRLMLEDKYDPEVLVVPETEEVEEEKNESDTEESPWGEDEETTDEDLEAMFGA
ncbi:hypothetical protein [Liquorilactobacillus hordei]|uniref:Phage related protein n=1 Tax=Liquorilactobacillus hordei DSM 19519 TaxID=1423759 RepID=A0A0R1MJA9_9LACO|nr:hypothetical protein [Liquorilactobacillus hordei]KRL08028.1 hypothetical protein FC92_GL001101 [Liquorilactobacillus hordei DSM 19519]QYH51028.1 hypothetical protein G6O70_00235 [Liquorilactobacillus hordei DSM 19519]